MAWNDSSQVARVIHPELYDQEFSSKGHSSQKSTHACPPPEPCKSAAAPGTQKPQCAQNAAPCCALGDLRRIPQCNQHLGPLEFSGTHKVLVNVRSLWRQICASKSGFLPSASAASAIISVLSQTQVFNREGAIVPHPGKDTWTRNAVKMPCSPLNTMYKHSSPKVCNQSHPRPFL